MRNLSKVMSKSRCTYKNTRLFVRNFACFLVLGCLTKQFPSFSSLPFHQRIVNKRSQNTEKENKNFMALYYCNNIHLINSLIGRVRRFNVTGSAVASWLVCSTPYRKFWVRALAGEIVLCSWARHFTLTVLPSTQVYKWVSANLMPAMARMQTLPLPRPNEFLPQKGNLFNYQLTLVTSHIGSLKVLRLLHKSDEKLLHNRAGPGDKTELSVSCKTSQLVPYRLIERFVTPKPNQLLTN